MNNLVKNPNIENAFFHDTFVPLDEDKQFVKDIKSRRYFVFHCLKNKSYNCMSNLYNRVVNETNILQSSSLRYMVMKDDMNNQDFQEDQYLWQSGIWHAYAYGIIGNFIPITVHGFSVALPNQSILRLGLATYPKYTQVGDTKITCPISHLAGWMNTVCVSDEDDADRSSVLAFEHIMNIAREVGISVYVQDD